MSRHRRAIGLRAVLATVVLTLPAFGPLPASAQTTDAEYATLTRIGAAIERCWFQSGDPAFNDYVYSPEPNASSGGRILIVPRNMPVGAPLLVIEVREKSGKPSINAFGPLATSNQAGRIGADLRRWLAGGEGCQ
jgi:hypothetical protein